MFITLGRLPDHPTAISRAAQLTGLAPSDAARLLAGTFPRVLLRAVADPEALLTALAAEGFLAWASDPAQVPTDDGRVIVRGLTWTADGFLAHDSTRLPTCLPIRGRSADSARCAHPLVHGSGEDDHA
jgi:hypothetical protein